MDSEWNETKHTINLCRWSAVCVWVCLGLWMCASSTFVLSVFIVSERTADSWTMYPHKWDTIVNAKIRWTNILFPLEWFFVYIGVGNKQYFLDMVAFFFNSLLASLILTFRWTIACTSAPSDWLGRLDHISGFSFSLPTSSDTLNNMLWKDWAVICARRTCIVQFQFLFCCCCFSFVISNAERGLSPTRNESRSTSDEVVNRLWIPLENLKAAHLQGKSK